MEKNARKGKEPKTLPQEERGDNRNSLHITDMRGRAKQFLSSIRAYLRTYEYQVERRDKNREFERRAGIRNHSAEQRKILLGLTAENCVKIGPNDSPRYPDAEVFTFKTRAELPAYGMPEIHQLYIKMYLVEKKNSGEVIVISLHDDEFPER